MVCAALGLVISAGHTVASNRRGDSAVNGQVGAELPPGGVRSLVVGQGSPVAPIGRSGIDASNLYDALRKRARVWRAWTDVYNRAKNSNAVHTREEAREFARNILPNLDRIRRKLQQDRFKFAPQIGVLLKKKTGGNKRPIVVAPIESRIVQRAILDALQDIPELRTRLTAGYNFGGVPGREFGVPGAILKAMMAMRERPHFLRTDVKSFFERVPKARAIGEVLQNTDDARFAALFTDAVETEIADAVKYGDDIRLFPLFEEGVAQGSCLSPLLCNLLLSNLDEQLNGRGIVTIRYIDDILILGKSAGTVFKAFASAQSILARLGLECYDPRRPADRAKAEYGPVAAGFEFLGCEIATSGVRPSRHNRRKLLTRINTILRDSVRLLDEPKTASEHHTTFAETLSLASRVIQGWANTFGFCTDDRVMGSLDKDISALVDRYTKTVISCTASMSDADRRRTLGVFLVADRVQPLTTRLLRSLA